MKDKIIKLYTLGFSPQVISQNTDEDKCDIIETLKEDYMFLYNGTPSKKYKVETCREVADRLNKLHTIGEISDELQIPKYAVIEILTNMLEVH